METWRKLGISMKEVTDKLTNDGVKLFADAFDKLLAAVEKMSKSETLAKSANRPTSCRADLADCGKEQTLTTGGRTGKVRRLWQRDASLWTGDDEANGWAGSASPTSRSRTPDRPAKFAEDVKSGGSPTFCCSAWADPAFVPEVLAHDLWPRSPAFPQLHVLDSTDPAQIKAFEEQDRSGEDAVHRFQQIGQHARAQHLQAIFL